MATIEDRLQILEQEHLELRKTIELQTIAIGALVNKATLERLNERYDKLFDTLIQHDRLTNDQLAELRTQQLITDHKIAELQTQVTETDGKVVGLQTQLRQTEKQIDARFEQVDTRFDRMEALLAQIIERLPNKQ
jgi:uncharacterized protein involved in exopolysaccharide biosynthesis